MPHLILTGRALRDLDRCYDFLVPKNPGAAARAMVAIRDGMQVLTAHPGAGRPVDRTDSTLRQWLVRFGDSGYIVLYRPEGSSVVVVSIRHQREAGFP